MLKMPEKTHYWFIRETHESCERNQRQSYCPTLPHSTNPSPLIESNIDLLCGYFDPKTQLYMIFYYKSNNKYSSLVHQRST